MHYSRWYRHGDPEKNPQPRRKPGQPGSIRYTKAGYIEVRFPEHPNAHSGGYLFEHVFIMSQRLDRALYPDERVHHKNGIKDDNRDGNLELWTISHPAGSRAKDALTWAHEIIKRYGVEDSLI